MPNIVSQLRFCRGVPISSSNASDVPADGHRSFFNSYLELVAAVVKIVSVELCAAVPVIVTEPGVKVQVGVSLAASGATEQVRFTVPVNPFDGVTVIGAVFPVVAPRKTLSVELPPPTINVGAAFTVSATVAVAVNEPEVPVIVTVTGPPTVAVLAAVSVTTLDPVAGFVPNDAVTPLGSPLAERVTLPVNPFAGFTVMVSVLLLPWVTDRLAAELESVKLGPGFNVRAMVVDAVSDPEVPVIVTVVGPPTVAEFVAVSVSTLDPVAGFVPNDAVTPLGSPLAVRVTLPLKPLAPATVIVSVLVLP
jgi:hypothetical protein